MTFFLNADLRREVPLQNNRMAFLATIARFCLGAVFVSSVCGIVWAQQPLDEEEQTAFQTAGDYAQESVVQIETFGGMEIVNRQAIAPGPSTGTIVSSDGWIVTSMFLFRSQPASITVVLPNDERKAAKLVARDHSREIALLKIEVDAPLTPVQLSDSKKWHVGQWTIALGKSFDARTASRSVGILSAKGRVWDKAIQTDCKISPHNYGGPLVDLEGKVMGILTPLNPGMVTEGEVEQWYDSGIGFAIPLADIIERLPTLQAGKDIYPGKAGVRILGRDEFLEGGMTLGGVSPGSPAAKAGLQAGDKIVRAGRSAETLRGVSMHSQLKHVLGPVDAEQPLFLEVERDGQLKRFEMKLVKELPAYKEPFLGIVTRAESDSSERIVQVVENSPAAKANLSPNDIVIAAGGIALTKEKGLEQILQFVDYRDPFELQIKNPDGIARTVSVQPTPRPETDITLGKLPVPNEEQPDSSKAAIGTVQLPLGDVKNKAFAIVPTTYRDNVPHGLLLLYADPGPQDSKSWSDVWEKFAEEHRWIVAVMQSADEKAWSFEESEIGIRLRTYLANNYSLDKRRICIGGLSSGGIMALVTAGQNTEDFTSVWISDAKISERVRLNTVEPTKSIRFFVNGTEESLKQFVSKSRESGYCVCFYPDSFASMKKPDAANVQDLQVFDKLQRWLRFLEAF
jgi:serine protease Do